MRAAVFVRAAPPPTKILRPLRAAMDRALVCEGPHGQTRVTPYVREFEVKRPGILHVTLRQELHLRQAVDAEGKATGERPKICRIVMEVLK